MSQKPAQKPKGRPIGSKNKPSKSAKFTKTLPSKLEKVLIELKELHRKGEIATLTEQKHLINAYSEYIYVSFKIPIKEVKK